jgi:hypothetical protein
MAKKTIQLGLDGDQAGEEEEEESEPSADDKGEEEEEEDPESKDKDTESKEEKALREKIEAEILGKIEKEKIAADLKKKDEKEKVSESMKSLADTLRSDLGEDYPNDFNNLKISPRITAMIGLKNALNKRAKMEPIKKGKSGIPKPKPKGKDKGKTSQFKATNSFKKLAENFDWIQPRE